MANKPLANVADEDGEIGGGRLKMDEHSDGEKMPERPKEKRVRDNVSRRSRCPGHPQSPKALGLRLRLSTLPLLVVPLLTLLSVTDASPTGPPPIGNGTAVHRDSDSGRVGGGGDAVATSQLIVASLSTPQGTLFSAVVRFPFVT